MSAQLATRVARNGCSLHNGVMQKRSEGFFNGYQDTRLFFQIWHPPEKPNGILLITHGQGEHSDCYHRLVTALAPMGILIVGWDLRGHGRSQGQRGYVGDFSEYSRDFEALCQQVLHKLQVLHDVPTVYFAHSMGTLVQLKGLAHLENGTECTQILSSPFLGLALEVPKHKQLAAEVLGKWLPRLTLSNEIDFEDLSRDLDVIEEFRRDTLRHQRISTGAYLGALETAEQILNQPLIWAGKVLFLLSDSDPVVSSPIIRKFADQMITADVQVEVFEKRKHELVNDLGREEVFQKVLTFLKTAY